MALLARANGRTTPPAAVQGPPRSSCLLLSAMFRYPVMSQSRQHHDAGLRVQLRTTPLQLRAANIAAETETPQRQAAPGRPRDGCATSPDFSPPRGNGPG